MISGVGIDLIEVIRIKNELEKYGDGFCERIFTAKEIAYCKRASNINVQSACFAGRFAAKEAFLKALGTGLKNGLKWKDMEICNDENGKPGFVLKDRALEMIGDMGILNVHLSISHCKNTAAAFVILEKPDSE